MGHIQLSREADLVVVCPATADLLAKMAAGIADDLATTLILATDKPVMAVPAMNVRMWEHEATQRNIELLTTAGVTVLHPDEGPMACGEFGYGRLPEPEAIWRAIAAHFGIAVPETEFVPIPANDRLAIPVEALEPEDEDGEGDGQDNAFAAGRLGGLLSRIIPRSTAKRTHEEIEAEFQDLPEAEDTDEPLPEEPAPEFAPDLGGPLLAKKGAANAAADNLGAIQPGDGGAIEQHLATAHRQLAGDEVKQRCLARAIGADNRRERARFEAQADIIGGDHAAEILAQLAQFEQAAAHGTPRLLPRAGGRPP